MASFGKLTCVQCMQTILIMVVRNSESNSFTKSLFRIQIFVRNEHIASFDMRFRNQTTHCAPDRHKQLQKSAVVCTDSRAGQPMSQNECVKPEISLRYQVRLLVTRTTYEFLAVEPLLSDTQRGDRRPTVCEWARFDDDEPKMKQGSLTVVRSLSVFLYTPGNTDISRGRPSTFSSGSGIPSMNSGLKVFSSRTPPRAPEHTGTILI